MTPGKEDTQAKEIPIEVFIKKIIGVREKLRVLEQKINNHPNLDAADKLELQGYITRSYGSLTTFNALFADKVSHFVGSGAGSSSED
jgi:superoxide dismutase